MKSSKKLINEKNLDSYLSSLGFTFPITESDLKRFREINSGYENELTGNEISPQKIIDDVAQEETDKLISTSNIKGNLYFKRVVLAGEIANQLHEEPTFGHIKFQKLMYLCEKVVELKTHERYSKQVAGPYDNKFMHSIDKEFKKQQWFEVIQEGEFHKFVYLPLNNLSNHCIYFNNYFKKQKESISWIIETFRKSGTKRVELVSTIFACLEEFEKNEEEFSESKLLEKFYSWSKRKANFSETDILCTLENMKKLNLTPKSFSNPY